MSEAEQALSLDLSSAIPLTSAFFEITHPATGAPSGWVWELAGPGHPKSIAIGNGISRERLQKEARLEAQSANGRKIKPEPEEPEDRARHNVTAIVGRVIGWSMRGKPNEVGERAIIGVGPVLSAVSPEPLAFSEKAALDLMLRPDMGWVLGPVAEYLASERAFTQGSAPI